MKHIQVITKNSKKGHYIMRKNTNTNQATRHSLITATLCILSFCALSAALIPQVVEPAYADEESTPPVPVNVSVGSAISITGYPKALSLDITDPLDTGTTASINGAITVSTNNATGYTLYVGMANPSSTASDYANALKNVADDRYRIDALSDHPTTIADFAANTWGIISPLIETELGGYTGLPATGTVKLGENNIPVSADSTDFTTAVKANTGIPSGHYANSIQFTAVTNAASSSNDIAR